LNAAIEKMLDLLHPARHDSVKFIKDVAATAVLFSSLAAVIVGFIIFPAIFFEAPLFSLVTPETVHVSRLTFHQREGVSFAAPAS
jgi:hypothetical protein